jgi:hypothetical protein
VRLRRGSGKSRKNQVDQNGNVIRNFISLGTLEDVKKKFPEYRSRIESYTNRKMPPIEIEMPPEISKAISKIVHF